MSLTGHPDRRAVLVRGQVHGGAVSPHSVDHPEGTHFPLKSIEGETVVSECVAWRALDDLPLVNGPGELLPAFGQMDQSGSGFSLEGNGGVGGVA